jgi:predicted glycosyltransferase
MKLLIDIGHPGHVHLFRPFAQEMIAKGHDILFTCRQKEYETELLKAADLKFICLGKHYSNKIGKTWGLIRFDFQILFIALKFKPDMFFSHGSFYAAQVAWLLRKPHISMEDTGNREQMRLYLPFTQAVLMPDVLKCDVGNKGIYYKSYHEIAYLHPKRFMASTKKVIKHEPYFILRFVAWNASHDIGHIGLSFSDKKEIIELLKQKGKVFISSEKKLPAEFEKYRLSIKPEQLHDVLMGATMVVGEGSTTVSESVLLGVPAIYISPNEVAQIREEEEYGLCFCFEDLNGVLDKIRELLLYPDLKEEFHKRYRSLLDSKIDVTAFMVWFIENWPDSFYVMKKNPEYQLNFK